MPAGVADAFRALTGASPAGIWAAPGRVNLLGEHTDYNDGFVLPFAVDRRAVVAARLRTDGVVRLRSAQYAADWTGRIDDIGPGRVDGWPGYVVGVAWALREYGADVPGFDLVLDSTVPVGAGLSSSAAVEAAVALALDGLLGLDLDRTTLATACRRAENEVVGAPTGPMDQITALHARAGHAILLDCRTLDIEHVPFDVAAAGVAVVVVDTRVAHATTAGGYADRRRACADAARALGVRALRDASPDAVAALADDVLRCRARHVVTENARVLDAADRLRQRHLRGVGPLLSASHVSMRDDFAISCPELDVAVDALHAAGALGARLTGAGFGGCALGLLHVASVDTAREAVRAAFAGPGYREPASFRVAPADGAARLA